MPVPHQALQALPYGARGRTSAGQDGVAAGALATVVELCSRLRSAGVVYCHWKSNDMLHLSASGDNDLDLLVDPDCLPAFVDILTDLGFKRATPPPRRVIPGVLHYYGLDVATGRLVHVDAQAQLVLGDDTTKNVRVPIESAYLASRTGGPLFPVPAPEFELAVLVVRLALKHGTWDSAVFGLASLKAAERRELAFLVERADPAKLERVVTEHLPQVGWSTWDRHCRALLNRAGLPERLRSGRRVVSSVAGMMRRSPAADTALRCWRRVEWGVRHLVLGQRNTKRLTGGGRLIAIVGGDGAGKSTLVKGLASWLNGPLDTQVVHMGKPPRSLLNVLVKGGVVVGRRAGLVRSWLPNYPRSDEHGGVVPGPLWLLWQLVTATDRERQYQRARRLTEQGYLVVCDRFPLDQVTLMDGPRTGWVPLAELSPIARRLVTAEQRRYAAMGKPDVLLVLRVDPETAVARKVGVDPAEFVRPRSAEVSTADWGPTAAVVLDASRSAAEVLAEARGAVWERL